MKRARTLRARRVWMSATPAYYWGTIVGALLFVIPCLVVLGVVVLVLADFAPKVLTSVSAWARLWSFTVTIVCLVVSAVTATVLFLTLGSVVDRLWVTTAIRDQRMGIHRPWYEACKAADPELDHPELWPKRPY